MDGNEKEKFFIELLHTDRGRNDISGGRLENNVLQYPDATKYRLCGEKYWDKLSEIFDNDLGEGSVDNPSDGGSGTVKSGDATRLVPDPDYLYYLICFAFKYELE
ncbi:hypothetical protein BUALT_Bualt12G0143900 [Buddleja alternifolia]|uniref:Uncharacterized protein n=1 Tax=Buddleja alternifolia TaxID=168488 RepID=A0AAV6WY60_9LAMI|nr:hypothetical protein BUALT_Bualt12G0143900 [Buddleja alternifolia]